MSRRSTDPPARRAAVLVIAVVTAVLTACGGDSGGSAVATTTSASSSAEGGSSPAGGSGASTEQSLTVTEADFTISLDKPTPTPGAYTIQVVNHGNTTHALAVEENDKDVAHSDAINPGQSTTLALTIVPATYVFYCPIDGHRAMGMEQTFTVR